MAETTERDGNSERVVKQCEQVEEKTQQQQQDSEMEQEDEEEKKEEEWEWELEWELEESVARLRMTECGKAEEWAKEKWEPV